MHQHSALSAGQVRDVLGIVRAVLPATAGDGPEPARTAGRLDCILQGLIEDPDISGYWFARLKLLGDDVAAGIAGRAGG